MRCERCQGPTVMARGRMGNGGWQVFDYCPACAKRVGTRNYPHRDVRDMDALPLAWDRLGEGWQPCERCGQKAALQEHHWAPRHLFGDECDDWPKSYLCQACHDRWHRIVTPNMSQPQRVGEVLPNVTPTKKGRAA